MRLAIAHKSTYLSAMLGMLVYNSCAADEATSAIPTSTSDETDSNSSRPNAETQPTSTDSPSPSTSDAPRLVDAILQVQYNEPFRAFPVSRSSLALVAGPPASRRRRYLHWECANVSCVN